ncbi:MAG: hypothetical protein O9256_00900 [Rhizobiaceae bacterium]|nr:hypothetical protein [Rhizobiaceae bacterium]
MTLLINTERPGDPTIEGVSCDRCKSEVRDSIELGEVLHIRLHAGCGSEWGDGNIVECDLCDACGHALLSAFAAVMPSSERYRGHVVTALDLRSFLSMVVDHSDGTALCAVLPSEEGSLWQKLSVRIAFEVRRFLLPAKHLLTPLWCRLKRLNAAIEAEERMLRRIYGVQREG